MRPLLMRPAGTFTSASIVDPNAGTVTNRLRCSLCRLAPGDSSGASPGMHCCPPIGCASISMSLSDTFSVDVVVDDEVVMAGGGCPRNLWAMC